ncbi:MAG TPA: hypothetical protein VH594_10445 [Trebonia sp.]|jgi:hypothetical protein
MDNRASVGAAYRAYAIDQAYEKVREIERGTVTPAMGASKPKIRTGTWPAWTTG